MSVAKITDHGYNVMFSKNKATITDRCGEVIAVADREDELYYIRELANNVSECNLDKAQLWHRRFGHLNGTDLNKLISNNLVFGLDSMKVSLPTCEVCIQGKMTQTPFSTSTRTSKNLLDIVHSDICGPLKTKSIGGSKYFITFIDDKSRWTVVKFLKTKGEALEAFKEYKALVENQTGNRIKCLQTDNGGEFVSREFSYFLKQNGIERRLTVPHTPQQNGVAERLNRTYMDMTRCLLIDSGLEERFWAEALAMVCHIRNRTPTSALNGNIPFKIWWGRRPTVSYFRTFGCKAFLLNKAVKNKLLPRAESCILVGYSEECKAYRVWLTGEQRIRVTRDIKFVGESEVLDKRVREINLLNEDEMKLSVLNNSFTDKNKGNAINESVRGEECLEPIMIRGRGRPKLVKTGSRGRPYKQYNMIPLIPNQENESSLETEVEEENKDIQEENTEHREENKEIQEETEEKVEEHREENKEIQEETEEEIEEHKEEEIVQMMEDQINSPEEALSGPDAAEWKEAIKKEFTSLIFNKTWTVCDRPSNRRVIGSRLILRNKYSSDGRLERRKARLVAKGYSQRPGEDFKETYAPVMRLQSLRVIAALAVEYDLDIHQFDIETAYLNGDLEESVFMEIPANLEEMLGEMIHSSDPNIVNESKSMLEKIKRGNQVCRLNKSLYGLKQSGRQWYKKLHEVLASLGLNPTISEPCLYTKKENNTLVLVGVYVDDIVVASNSSKWTFKIKEKLKNNFRMKDLGAINYCLGIEFTCNKNKNEIEISQRKYIRDLLCKYGMSECKPAPTPLDVGSKLTKSDAKRDSQNFPYRQLMGSLMYLSVGTRPDITYAVNSLSQFNECYDETHWKAAKRVLRYLSGTLEYSLKYVKSGKPLECFADANWGNCPIDRKSYTGYIFILSGAAISWEAKKQATVALSSVEAEYMALAEAAKEAVFLRRFLSEIVPQPNGVVIKNDSQGAQKLAKHPIHHSRTKHIDIRHHFIRQTIDDGSISVEYQRTEEMPADMLTKPLPIAKHGYCSRSVGVSRHDNIV